MEKIVTKVKKLQKKELHCIVKSFGRKTRRWRVYFSDGTPASNRIFRSKESAEMYLRKMNAIGGFMVWNATDGIYASGDIFPTKKAADAFVRSFPKRFAGQGYYLTSGRERIFPEDVDLRIIKAGDAPPLDEDRWYGIGINIGK
jgi:hypothetical protein